MYIEFLIREPHCVRVSGYRVSAHLACTHLQSVPSVQGTAVEGHSASPADQQEVVTSAASSSVLLDDVNDRVCHIQSSL